MRLSFFMQRGAATVISRRWVLPGFGAEMVLQATLAGLAVLLATVLPHTRMTSVDHAFTMLGSSVAIAAAILLALGGWLGANGPAIRIAFAIAAYGIFLLVKALGSDPSADAMLARDCAVVGTAVLCGLALRGVDVVDRVWRTSMVIVTALLTGCAIVSLVPPGALDTAARSAIDAGAGVVTGTIGLALAWGGLRSAHVVLRSAGLALLMLSAQQSPIGSALGLAGLAMLLVTAVPFVVRALRAIWSEQAESQSRLHAAEQAMAVTAVRDHEMRNLVAGLCGAVNVLTTVDLADHGQLGAAARTELERLRRILDSDQGISGDQGTTQAQSGPSPVAVGPILSDLAALHGTPDAPIEVSVTEEPHALVSPDCLAHVVTNLLVNCARHAPGAHVWMTARRHGELVVIEVTDDGPGLPPGRPAELFRRGTRGPTSTGTGLGLSVSAEIIQRHGGEIRLEPAVTGGCTVVMELPAATARSLDTVPA